MKIDAVIFDMDGVIFDSERAYMVCCIEVGKKYNLENVEEVCLKCIGINSRETARILYESYGDSFPLEKYRQEVYELFREVYGNGKLPVKEGVQELLGYLKSAGVPMAIASSTKSSDVKMELDEAGLLKYFDKVIGGEMVERSKPEPDIFLKAAEELGMEPENCLVIEDSHNGVRAAYTAGMIPVMVPDLLEPTPEMKEKTAAIYKTLLDVIGFMETRGEY